MEARLDHARVLSIYPSHRGFAFSLLEGRTLTDWGIAKLYSKSDEEFLTRLEAMIDKHRPQVLALESPIGSRRKERVQKRVVVALGYARFRDIETTLTSRSEVRSVLGLSDRHTNHELATRIAELLPELATLLPRKRRLWESENEKIKIFQAAGIAIAAVAHA